ncbi:MAG: tRNA lysidine(34) synthetase TilS [Oscillospiraceae bacterium]|nr:tRNA lysidine(34) synthetase TilS [Oscillospiraceae bacterium]
MLDKIRGTIKSHAMLTPGDHVIAALSGGADSMTMLSLLCLLKDELGVTLEAAHVNHGLRGAESDGDEMFARKVCESLGVKMSVLRADIRAEAAKTGEGLEECGRRIRYEFFASVSPGAKVATAHTKSDCLETALFNFTRGTGIRGLCGIPAVRGNIIRPLIECTRAEIEHYCRENGIEYVTDSTNKDDAYARNRIRHMVVPRLKEINPSVEEAAYRCMRSFRRDDDFLELCTEKLLSEAKTENGWSAEILSSAHGAVRSRAVLALLKTRMSEPPQTVHTELVTDILRTGGAVQLDGVTTAAVKNGVLFFKERERLIEPWAVRFSLCENTDLPVGTAKTSIINKNELNNLQKIHKEVLANCLDCDKITFGELLFRSRREGDKLRQASGGCTKTLKKLLNEKKIPPARRDGVVLLADESGVLWVEGYGCDERVRITDDTRRVLMIDVLRRES